MSDKKVYEPSIRALLGTEAQSLPRSLTSHGGVQRNLANNPSEDNPEDSAACNPWAHRVVTTSQKCAAVPREARIKAHRLRVSLNSRIESDKKEGEGLFLRIFSPKLGGPATTGAPRS